MGMNEWAMGWLTQSEQAALGWTLLHFLWQGAAIAAIFAVADRAASRAAYGVRYAVALGALALMPLTVMTTFVIEMRAALPSPAAAAGPEAHALGQALMQRIPPAVTARAGARGADLTASARQLVSRLLPVVDGLWMVGVLVLAVRGVGGWLQLERMRGRARGVVPPEIERTFERLKRQVRVGRRAVVRISDEVISPLVMGIWRATVILPASALLQLSIEELEAVLAHELGHVRRWDYLINLMQTAVESVLFFHPAVWWLSRVVRERREVCCDEIAVGYCRDAVVYAQALLRLEEQKTAQLRLALAFKGRGGSLLDRVERVLGEGRTGRDRTMEERMTSGVRVAVAGAVLAALILAPRVSDAVVTPLMRVAQPMLAHGTAVQDTEEARAKDVVAVPVEVAQAVVPAPKDADRGPAETAQVASLQPTGGPEVDPAATGQQGSAEGAPAKHASYIDGMRAAGYALDLNNDLDDLVSMKAVGVTPEYAKAMGQLGLGKPTVKELISLRALGVTPEYIAGLKQSGLGPKGFKEVESEKALGLTPEYSAEMKKAGFGDMDVQDLISLKATGMTPEYAQWLKKQFPGATVDQLRQASVFHLDDKFLAAAKSHGFDGRDIEKLLRLKISGLLDE
jgi:beta-lactamase regulating signal transducer with metallopeptidase domain